MAKRRKGQSGGEKGRRNRQAEGMPHDALFKRTFGDPANVAGELMSVLPDEVLRHLDLSTLRPLPGSFIDEDLVGSHTDLLFEVKANGREALLYVLFEHQSTNDELMALRLLTYMVRIWRRDRKTSKRPLPLPPIVPPTAKRAGARRGIFTPYATWTDGRRR